MSPGFVFSTQRERGFCFLLVFLLTCSFGWIKYSEFLYVYICVCVCVSSNPTSYWIPLNKVVFRFESKWKRHTNLFWYLQINNAEFMFRYHFVDSIANWIASCCMTTWIHIYPKTYSDCFNISTWQNFLTVFVLSSLERVFLLFLWNLDEFEKLIVFVRGRDFRESSPDLYLNGFKIKLRIIIHQLILKCSSWILCVGKCK